MTERSESERAELVDKITQAEVAQIFGDMMPAEAAVLLMNPGDRTTDQLREALRRLAAQDQEPVAWRYRYEGGKKWTVQKNKPTWYDPSQPDVTLEPLFTAPPPAAGWDERDLDAAIAAYNVVWQQAEGIEAKNVDEVRRNAMSAALEALRHSAPPDSGAGLPPIDESLHTPELISELQKPAMQLGLPDHGGADAGVGEYLARPSCRCFDERSRELCLDKDRCRPIATALSHQPAPVAANASAEAITDDQITYANELAEDRRHAWANASAEARLRWALKEAQRFIASVSDISPSVQRRRDSVWTLLDKAISVLPYTAKSEGGLNEQARNPVRLPDGSGDLASAGGIARDDIKDHHRQVGGNSPSDRTSDVMEGWTGQKCPYCKGTGENLSNPMNSGACNKCGGTGDEYAALSAHPHASDCDKQGLIEIGPFQGEMKKPGPSDRTADDLPAIRSANDWDKQGER